MGFASATAGRTVPGLAGGEEVGDIGPRTAPPPATPVGQESASIPSVWAETGDSSFFGLEPVAERLGMESKRRPRGRPRRDFTPSGTSYQGYTTAAFTVGAGTHTKLRQAGAVGTR
jgi:hypothetical protein